LTPLNIRIRNISIPKIIIATAIAMGFSIITKAQWLPGFGHRKLLTLDHTVICGTNDLTDFPFFLNITDNDLRTEANGGRLSSINGFDISFTANDGTTLLHHELHSYDPITGELMAWIQIPLYRSAVDTDIYIYYDNESTTADPSSELTWDNNFEAVLHLQESGTGADDEYLDGTANNAHGTGGGIPGAGVPARTPTRVAGIMGFAQEFDDAGDQDLIRVRAIDDDTWEGVTVEAWVYPHDGDDDRIFGKTWGTGTDNQTWLLRKHFTGQAGTRMRTDTDNEDGFDVGAALAINQWHHLATTWDSNTNEIRVFINGVEEGVNVLNGNSLFIAANTDLPTIGNTTTLNRGFDGLIQECRVSNIARNADWVCTEYTNQSDPTSVFTISPEESCLLAEGGVIIPFDNILDAGESTFLELNGSDGDIQWQSSTDNINFTDIAAATGQMLITGAITVPTYFRALVSNTGCVDASNTVQIDIRADFLGNYAFRKRITIDQSMVCGTTPLSNFPVFINLTDPDISHTSAGGQVQNIDGYDIVFTGADGVTQYDHEIHSYEFATGEFMAWVRIPSLNATTDTELFIYYGNCTAVGSPSLASTWDQNYRSVLHMQENGSGADDEYQDSAGDDIHGTGGGIAGAGNAARTPVRTAGVMGFAQEFDDAGDQDVIRLRAIDDDTWTEVSVQAWVYPHDNGDDRLFGKTWGTGTNQQTWLLRKNGAGRAGSRMRTDLQNNGGFDPGDPMAVNNWYHLAVTWSATTNELKVYQNGVEIGSNALNGNTMYNFAATENASIGNTSTLNRGFDGLMQECRVSDISRSEDWFCTEYTNQINPTVYLTIGPEEIEYYWTGAVNTNWGLFANWSHCAVPEFGANISIPDVVNDPILDVERTVGRLTIQEGANANGSAFNLNIIDDFQVDGTFIASTGTVTLNGTTLQRIQGSSPIDFNNLTINNTLDAVSVVIETPVTVASTLQLDDGILWTDVTNMLTLDENATATQAANIDNSFVNGPMTKITSSTDEFVFPVGKEERSLRIGVTPVSTNLTNWTAEYFHEEQAFGTALEIGIDHISSLEHWILDRSGATPADGRVRLFWNDSSITENGHLDDLRVVRWGGTMWNDHGNEIYDGDQKVGSVQSEVISAFSPFTLGSFSLRNPLPIELLDFTAELVGDRVELDWITASESNNAFFSVERSADGFDWITIQERTGANNSSELIYYEAIDENPLTGISYYRLRQTDFDGTHTYSQTEVIRRIENEVKMVEVFPVPSNDYINVTLVNFGNELVKLQLFDHQGRAVGKNVLQPSENVFNFILPRDQTIADGMYFLKITTTTNQFTKKVVFE